MDADAFTQNPLIFYLGDSDDDNVDSSPQRMDNRPSTLVSVDVRGQDSEACLSTSSGDAPSQSALTWSASKEELDQLLASIPRDSAGNLTSVGSKEHADRKCTVCLYYRRPHGCALGIYCKYCHIPHPRRFRYRPCKQKRDRAKLRAARAAESVNTSDAPGGCAAGVTQPDASVNSSDAPGGCSAAVTQPGASVNSSDTPDDCVAAVTQPGASVNSSDVPGGCAAAVTQPDASVNSSDTPIACAAAVTQPGASVNSSDTPGGCAAAVTKPDASVNSSDTPGGCAQAVTQPAASETEPSCAGTREHGLGCLGSPIRDESIDVESFAAAGLEVVTSFDL